MKEEYTVENFARNLATEIESCSMGGDLKDQQVEIKDNCLYLEIANYCGFDAGKKFKITIEQI